MHFCWLLSLRIIILRTIHIVVCTNNVICLILAIVKNAAINSHVQILYICMSSIILGICLSIYLSHVIILFNLFKITVGTKDLYACI